MTATTALASVERGVFEGRSEQHSPRCLGAAEPERAHSRRGNSSPCVWHRACTGGRILWHGRGSRGSDSSRLSPSWSRPPGYVSQRKRGAVGQASSGTVQIDGGTLLEMQPRAESRNPDAACSLAALAFRDLLRQKHGHSALGADLIAGAFLEMVDNAIEHSESSVPIWASCQVLPLGWSFSVTDVGCGVVKSLSRNPKYASVDHGAKALGLALEDGVSGVAKAGRGHGFSRLFKCLADRQCHLRCRSDAAAIDWRGVSPTDQQVQVPHFAEATRVSCRRRC